MQDLKGKRLLIIGGAFQHCKVVEAAKELGVITYVVDFLEKKDSPAKQISDKEFFCDIFDIEGLLKICKKEKIDGVISTSLDACQRPYQKLCECMGFPCFGNERQFKILTDKTEFKKCCMENDVDVIQEFFETDFTNNCKRADICFPIIVKPCDSRGSRGQTICNNREDVLKAIEFAKRESTSGKVVIEKYMGQKNDFSVSYIFIDGEAYLTRIGDRYLGDKKDFLDKLAIAGMAPSIYSKLYIQNVNERVVSMLKNIGIKNGPIFMQGFVDGNTVRFYDPGLRFPGIEYERMYKKVYGIDLLKLLIEFSLTGKVSEENKKIDKKGLLNGQYALNLLIAIRPGKISKISGLDQINSSNKVVSVFTKYRIGQVVGETYNVNQRFCEIDIVCNSLSDIRETVDWIYRTLSVKNDQNEEMLFGKVDLNIFDKYE